MPSATHLLVSPDHWNWQNLSDYVDSRMTALFGQPSDLPTYKKKAIYGGFIKRHGAASAKIAQWAFENCGGVWNGDPVTATRFCAAADEHFAAPILASMGA